MFVVEKSIIHDPLIYNLLLKRITHHFLKRCLTRTQMAIKAGTPINIAAMIAAVPTLTPLSAPDDRAKPGDIKRCIYIAPFHTTLVFYQTSILSQGKTTKHRLW
jgi:hypothetical protein